ncbi:type-1 angiotensin II receptor-associated protein isoform X4 [Neovison vison]|uniref:type-1 angiotensin II receptor-associated protein isoform X4 n=2 Tax=Neovison vison TaxID=452646 RepID=UPI001CF0A7E3|nr:type-1 angiotensin II receptor-associated protein isoform X4 [Neogale vison]
MELPAVNLKMILLVHWLLTTWGCITFSGPYPWANFTILAVGVWAVAQRDSVDAMSLPCEEAVPSFQPRCVLTSLAHFSACRTPRTLSLLVAFPEGSTVSRWLGSHHLPGHRPHQRLLPAGQLHGHTALRCRHGHPEPAPQALVLLLRLPHVPGARGFSWNITGAQWLPDD